jgi:predicted RNA binding protein YcfA (HicA-like mRNA interferase family)
LKLPRDLSGDELVRMLHRYGYEVTRQTGSHMRLTSVSKGKEHHITIPAHKQLRLGTLAEIVGEVAAYMEIDKDTLARDLFER